MLAVKLALPARPPLFLARERLRQQLVHWVQYRVIVVSAPAGYGKSMLAADFLNSLAGEPVRLAWLSLDEDDDDPARFVAALAAALAISQEGGGGHIPPLQLLLQLLDRLIAQGTTVMLALDDLHRLKNPAVHKLLAFAIEHSPAFLHWFLLSRHKPALGLSRLRLQKQVLEIGSSDLRLERAELEQYLLLAGQDKLSTASIDLLENRMQGWIAGVRLALLSLHGQTLQGSSMLEHLHGDNR
ncbi:MAG: AAA family ATPase, partial [Caldilinea sp.]|nr:AAA family ATPase [Caldilinea sp.]